MNVFAHGFSERLNIEATKHRPPSTTLSYKQIVAICALAGYEIEITTSRFDSSEFSIHRPDGEINPGLEDGLDIIWYVRAVEDTCSLVYFPTLKPIKTYGHDSEVIDEMLLRLASFLPNLGYQNKLVCLDEEFVIIPHELRYLLSTGINVMHATEFQRKYKPLYLFLKEKMVTPR